MNMSEPAYLKPKVLNLWVAERAVQPERTYIYPNIDPPRFHSQSEPLPEPTDEFLDESHRKWLEKYRKECVGKMYPIAHAVDKVHKAQEKYDSHKKRRDMTRDILSRVPAKSDPSSPESPRSPLSPNISAKAKKGLASVMGGVRVTSTLAKMHGIDRQKEAEEADLKKLQKAKSAPILQHGPQRIPGQVDHLRRFQYTTQALQELRTTTPWKHKDEVHELKTLGRMRKTF
jgi:hypothetical protein